MFKKISQIFKDSELRNKIFFILFAFIVFRIMAGIPIPGVNVGKMQALAEEHAVIGVFNMLTGGALETVSIIMLGLGPFITSIIILQLLTVVFPRLKAMRQEEGEEGTQRFNQYGRLLTIFFAAIQSFGMLTLLRSQGVISLHSLDFFIVIVIVVAATILLMWIGELITEKGVGNGISLLIFAGIISMVPMQLLEIKGYLEQEIFAISHLIILIVLGILITILIILINEGRRNISISYAKRIKGSKMLGGTSSYLPLNINPSGVIPVIFAMPLMMFPTAIAGFLVQEAGIIGSIAVFVSLLFANIWFKVVFLFLLIIFFTYFYTTITFDTKQISENLQKMGGFISGIRPGEKTKAYLDNVLNRVLLVAGFFLGFLAVLPMIIGDLFGIAGFDFLIGGIGLIIVVSVLLESNRQINSQIQMKEYDKY